MWPLSCMADKSCKPEPCQARAEAILNPLYCPFICTTEPHWLNLILFCCLPIIYKEISLIANVWML